MYLHQQLIDNLVLYVKLPKLQSMYTYVLTNNNNNNTIKEWCKYNVQPNNRNKLRYQFKYEISNYWHYINGPHINENTMKYAANTGNLELFRICLNGGINPTQECLELAANIDSIDIIKLCISNDVIPSSEIFIYHAFMHDNDELFDICLNVGVFPDTENLDTIYNIKTKCYKILYKACKEQRIILNQRSIECAACNPDVFNLCIEQGIKPNYVTMQIAAIYGNLDTFKKCIEFVVPDQTIIDNAAYNSKNPEIFDLCLDLNLRPNQDTIGEAAHGGNIDIFKLCIKFGILPNQRTMESARRIDMIKLCMNYGLFPNIRNLESALQISNIEIFKFCLMYTQPDRIIIENAIRNNNLDIFELCLDYVALDESIISQIILYNRPKAFDMCINRKNNTKEVQMYLNIIKNLGAGNIFF